MELEKTMAQLGKERRLSNGNLGKMAGTPGAVIGLYDRNEITPSIEIANCPVKNSATERALRVP